MYLIMFQWRESNAEKTHLLKYKVLKNSILKSICLKFRYHFNSYIAGSTATNDYIYI